ncbi:hypothetical protein pb186bvf_020667 [Paramecium bursaria]
MKYKGKKERSRSEIQKSDPLKYPPINQDQSEQLQCCLTGLRKESSIVDDRTQMMRKRLEENQIIQESQSLNIAAVIQIVIFIAKRLTLEKQSGRKHKLNEETVQIRINVLNKRHANISITYWMAMIMIGRREQNFHQEVFFFNGLIAI